MTLAVSFVADVRVTVLTVMSGPKETEPPDVNVEGNPEPTRLTFVVAPRRTLTGLTEVAVGKALTAKVAVPVDVPPSGLTTEIVRLPVAAVASIETSRVNAVTDTNDVECTVTPVPETVAVAPGWKAVPVTVTA